MRLWEGYHATISWCSRQPGDPLVENVTTVAKEWRGEHNTFWVSYIWLQNIWSRQQPWMQLLFSSICSFYQFLSHRNQFQVREAYPFVFHMSKTVILHVPLSTRLRDISNCRQGQAVPTVNSSLNCLMTGLFVYHFTLGTPAQEWSGAREHLGS